MSKKKRKLRQQSGAGLPSARAEKLQIMTSGGESRTTLFYKLLRNRAILVTAAVLLIAAASVFAFFSYQRSEPKPSETPAKSQQESPEMLLQRLSRSNFEGTEKQVVAKIRQLIIEVQKNPTSAFAWGKLAMNLDVHDLKNESLICYDKAGVLNPQDFRWPYYQGVVLAAMGSAEAASYFERATNLKPGYAPAWTRYGQALFDAKRADEAAEKFQRALELEPTSHAYVGLARVQLSKGQLQESLANLLEAIRLQPQHGEAHGLLAEVYRRLNRPNEAQSEHWIRQQLPERTPLPDIQMAEWANEGVSSYWYDTRGRAYLKQGRYDLAVQELTMAANATTDARIYDTLGIAYQYLRRYDEAGKYHQKALELQPKSGSILNNMASVYFEQGNLPKALEFMQKAIQAEPNFAYSYHHLGQIHLRTGNPKLAIEAYRIGYKRVPQNTQLATQLAWLLATTQDPSLRDGKEAVRLVESVVQRSPSQDPQTLIALAAAYAENRQFDRAVQTATKARELLGTSGNQLAARIDSHIALYQQKKPYREKG